MGVIVLGGRGVRPSVQTKEGLASLFPAADYTRACEPQRMARDRIGPHCTHAEHHSIAVQVKSL